jgi:hypothetical protein
MKINRIIFNVFLPMLALGLILGSCQKNDDLLTADAKTGGLAVATKSIPYLLGATPKIDVVIDIPQGPGITSIEVFNVYLRKSDTTYSNEVLMKTIDVSSANANADVEKTMSLVYADLINGITVDGAPLPTDENLLPIGDNFTFTYVSIMADGSRRVMNNGQTSVDVANRWVGSYLMKGWTLRAGDPVLTGSWTANWKLATVSAYAVKFWATQRWADGSTVGGIGPWVLTIDVSGGPDANMPVTISDPANAAVKNNPDYNNHYDPSTKTFYLSCYWGSGPTNRAAVDTLIYTGPY